MQPENPTPKSAKRNSKKHLSWTNPFRKKHQQLLQSDDPSYSQIATILVPSAESTGPPPIASPLMSLKLTISDGGSEGMLLPRSNSNGSRSLSSPTSMATTTTATTTTDEQSVPISPTIVISTARTKQPPRNVFTRIGSSDMIQPATTGTDTTVTNNENGSAPIEPSHSLSSGEIPLSAAVTQKAKQQHQQQKHTRQYSYSVGSIGSSAGSNGSSPPMTPTGNFNNKPYGQAFIRPLNLAVFSEWKVPFCFLCGENKGPDYTYIASIRDTGYMYGCHEIDGIMIRDPVIYRQLYVCEECDLTVLRANPPIKRVKLHPDAHTLFL